MSEGRYVSSVEGRAVTRWDTLSGLIGARVTTAEERTNGAPPIVWDTERVIKFNADFCRRFHRELQQALALGDLRERTAADYEAQQKKRAEERKRREEERKQAEAAAKAATAEEAKKTSKQARQDASPAEAGSAKANSAEK